MRLRLTLLYGGLFLLSGAALLTTTYLLVRNASGRDVTVRTMRLVRPDRTAVPVWPRPSSAQDMLAGRSERDRRRADELNRLVVQSGVALALMSLVSVGLGWVVAGRVLRPLRTMTQTTRRISQHTLHERLAIEGPDDELRQLADTIDELLARLEAAFDAQRRFVANVSHELRTPLTMIRTSLDVAAAKPAAPSPELLVLDGKLREGLDQADRVLESFLALARAEHGAPSTRTAVALGRLVAAALEDRRAAILKRRLEVESPVVADAHVCGDLTLLSRMVSNLFDNAVCHNRPDGWIRVTLAADGGTAQLSVENGGERLEQAAVEQLAQPFRRLAAERVGSLESIGLGLSIVAAIATAHDGRLHLRARDEGGLRAVVELPLAVPA